MAAVIDPHGAWSAQLSIFSVSAWKLSDFSGLISNNVNITTPNPAIGTSSTLSSSASPITVLIDDDDDLLHDRFIDPGEESTLSVSLEIDGTIYPAGSSIEAEYLVTTDDDPSIDIIIVRIGPGGSNSGENVLVVSTSEITPGQSFNFIDGADGPAIPYNDIIDPPICFKEGTEISTPMGPRKIEELSIGDLIETRDHGSQPIRWISCRRISQEELIAFPHWQPINFTPSSIGNNLPSKPLSLSPQHRILIRSAIAKRMFGSAEVLIPAVKLLSLPGIERERSIKPFHYYHLLMDQHEILYANGLACETLLLGEQVLETLSSEALDEIRAFIEASEINLPLRLNNPARHIPKGKTQKKMVERHSKNRKMLFS